MRALVVVGVIVVLICLVIGLIALWCARKWPNTWEKFYGHPWSPLKELWKQLPPPPLNHEWETTVTVEADGHHHLKLALMDLRTQRLTGSAQVDLTRASTYWDWDKTTDYRSHRKIFQEKVMSPLLRWAKAQQNETRVGEVCEYQLGKEKKP